MNSNKLAYRQVLVIFCGPDIYKVTAVPSLHVCKANGIGSLNALVNFYFLYQIMLQI